MNWIWCKYLVWGSFMYPLLCSAGTPDSVPAPEQKKGTVAVEKMTFPVVSFDLNDEKQLDALANLYADRIGKVQGQSDVAIRGVFSVRDAGDIEKLLGLYDLVCGFLSELDIRFMNDIRENAYLPISALGQGIKITVSGASDIVRDITGVGLAISADSLRVHHLKWGDKGISNALGVGASDTLELDHLAFSDNKYDAYFRGNVEPRLEIASYADGSRLTDVTVHDVTFSGNKTSSLMRFERDASGKIGSLTIKNVTISGNETYASGLDVSVAKKVVLDGVTVIGHIGKPVFEMKKPGADVAIRNSKLPEDLK